MGVDGPGDGVISVGGILKLSSGNERSRARGAKSSGKAS